VKFESRTTRIDGAVTHHLEGGPASAEKFVLIHDGGFGADGWATWAPVMPRLAERYHVFAPDMLGFGKTQKLYDFGQGARSQKIDHLAKWMKATGIDAAHVMGNSAGGSLVVFAAMRGEWPIRKAISIGGTGGPYMRADTYGPLRDYVPDRQAMRLIVELMMSRRDAVMEQSLEERYQKSLIRGHWENLSAPRLRPPGPGPREEGDNKGFFDRLAKTRVPVLLIAGSDDVLLERGWEKQLAAHIPNSQTLVVEGARHQPHFDAPEAVCNAIESFLSA
jgi:pimeloyl-ACP methyl ester carboxylesterase